MVESRLQSVQAVLRNPRQLPEQVVERPRPYPLVNLLLVGSQEVGPETKYMAISMSCATLRVNCPQRSYRQYGSGYPGVAGRGVASRGFPFVFWPLAWGGVAGVGAGAYLHNSEVSQGV